LDHEGATEAGDHAVVVAQPPDGRRRAVGTGEAPVLTLNAHRKAGAGPPELVDVAADAADCPAVAPGVAAKSAARPRPSVPRRAKVVTAVDRKGREFGAESKRLPGVNRTPESAAHERGRPRALPCDGATAEPA
jgi:hypothetical protein